MSPQIPMVVSAGILFTLGGIHLLYTFHGAKLRPREHEVQAAMERSSMVITGETTVWRAWLGFNASHSMGALLFGLIYGFLAIEHGAMLFRSPFLLAVGLVTLLAYLLLGKLYWFRVPFAGIAIALACYAASLVLALS